MPTATQNIQERGSEWRATAEAAMIVRILNELANETSGKKFARSRATRIERWTQLENVAHQQMSGLNALAKAPTVRKRPVKAATTVPLQPGHIEPQQAAS